MSRAANWMWRDVARVLLDVEARRHPVHTLESCPQLSSEAARYRTGLGSNSVTEAHDEYGRLAWRGPRSGCCDGADQPPARQRIWPAAQRRGKARIRRPARFSPRDTGACSSRIAGRSARLRRDKQEVAEAMRPGLPGHRLTARLIPAACSPVQLECFGQPSHRLLVERHALEHDVRHAEFGVAADGRRDLAR
jgi:hypothetical protein